MTPACRKVVAYSLAATFASVHDTVRSSLRAQEVRVSQQFSATQAYDSNLFSSSMVPEGDFITRVSPGIEGEYRAHRFSFLGRYVLDLEQFAAHPELTTAAGGQHASIDLRTSRLRRLAFAVDAALARTRTPAELSAATGLTLARAPAEHLEVHPVLVRELNPVTEATLDYAWTEDRLVGGNVTHAHRAALGIDRHVSRRDVVGVDYGVRMFLFAADDRLTAHVASIGWTRQITREARVELRGGPVLMAGRQAPEVLASVSYRPGPSELSIAYARTQTTLIGFAGILDTQSVTASAAFMLWPHLQIRIVPGVFRTTSDAQRADAGRLAFEVKSPITGMLSWRAGYEANFQRGGLTTAPFANSISRHLVQLSVVAARGRRSPAGR
jgi:hypothetical protein